jgi:hypothetical protein
VSPAQARMGSRIKPPGPGDRPPGHWPLSEPEKRSDSDRILE